MLSEEGQTSEARTKKQALLLKSLYFFTCSFANNHTYRTDTISLMRLYYSFLFYDDDDWIIHLDHLHLN